MADLKKCPNCGSTSIKIDGVVQKKKTVLYYLSGQGISDRGEKQGYKMGRRIRGDQDKPNAECLECGHKWLEK